MIVKKTTTTLFILVGILFFIGLNMANAQSGPEKFELNKVRLFFFGTPACPHCQDEKKFLPTLEKKYPNLEVIQFDVSEGFKSQSIFQRVVNEYDLTGSVPVNVIGNEVIVGFGTPNTTGKELEQMVRKCSVGEACSSEVDNMLGLSAIGSEKVEVDQDKFNELFGETNGQVQLNQKDSGPKVNLFGKELNINKNSSAFFWAVILGLADGVNPCMFSVLFFLLSYLLVIGSRKRALKAGIAFIITTFLLYFIFMYGIIQIVDILGIAQQARFIIAFIALIIGGIMIKDFFFYGKYISLEIPTSIKPKLEMLARKGTILSAIILAILAGIVELPCTSGLPLAYISILVDQELNYFWYIALYNLFFILPLAIIVIFVVFIGKKSEELENWRKSSRKYMRLIAGILLVFLGIAFLFNWL